MGHRPATKAQQQETKAAALAEIDRMVRAGTLVCRQATPEERERFGIAEFQERRRRELDIEQRRRVEARRRMRAPKTPTPIAPAFAASLRAARQAERDAPGEMNRLLVSVVTARAVSIARISQITGLSTSTIADRLQRTRRAVAEPVEITDAESQLQEARARELSTPGEFDELMLDAVRSGATRAQIADAVGLAECTVGNRINSRGAHPRFTQNPSGARAQAIAPPHRACSPVVEPR